MARVLMTMPKRISPKRFRDRENMLVILNNKPNNKIIKGIKEGISEVRLNGHPTDRLPKNVNFSIQYIEGEGLLLLLDMAGIAASSGSACTSGSLDPSHVLLAIGLLHELAHGSLRLTISEFTTEEDIDYLVEKLPPIVERLRQMSPLYSEKYNRV